MRDEDDAVVRPAGAGKLGDQCANGPPMKYRVDSYVDIHGADGKTFPQSLCGSRRRLEAE